MPHDSLPEGAAHWLIGAIGTALGALAGLVWRLVFGRVKKVEEYARAMEKRVINLERLYAVQDARHRENLRRFDDLQATVREIDRKIDRLMERR